MSPKSRGRPPGRGRGGKVGRRSASGRRPTGGVSAWRAGETADCWFDEPLPGDRRSWAAPPGHGTYQGLDLERLNPDDEDERGFLLEAQHLEMAEALERHEEIITESGEAVNPRLHVTLHGVVANQLLADDPPETWQTVRRLAGLGYDWHNGQATVTELADAFKVSADTVRRDLGWLATIGPVAFPGTEGISADVAVIGVGGVSARAGFTTTNLQEAQMMAQMIESAQRTIVVMHSSKFGRSAFAHIVRLDAIGVLITDRMPEAELQDALAAAEVEIVSLPAYPVSGAVRRSGALGQCSR
jgi:hypothetical protein